MQRKLEAIATGANGKVGIAARVIEAGESVSLKGTGHFPMQSVYKLPIVMAVLQRVDQGKLALEQKIKVEKRFYSPVHSPIRDKYPEGGVELTLKELMAAAIVDSDGAASDILLSLVSPAEVTAYLRGLGIREMNVALTEKGVMRGEMVQYRNWATPHGAIELLEKLQEGTGISANGREMVLKWMMESVPGANRLKGLLPAGTAVAHKTGTSGTSGGLTRATNDIGIVTLPDGRHLAIAVFVSDAKGSEEAREGVIAESALAVWDCWNKSN
ncbi:MAG: class A beta-lactamase [Candidatus Acidiferrum sp.]